MGRSNWSDLGKLSAKPLVWPDSQNSESSFSSTQPLVSTRSADGGQTWANIWPGMSFRNNDFYLAGYIRPILRTTLYLSAQGESGSFVGPSFRVYRLNQADTTTFVDPDDDPNIDLINTHSGGIEFRASRPPIAASTRKALAHPTGRLP